MYYPSLSRLGTDAWCFSADDVKTQRGRTPLDIAISEGYTELALLLIRKGAIDRLSVSYTNLERDEQDDHGKQRDNWLLIHSAAIAGHPDVISMLVDECGMDANARCFVSLR